MVDVGCGDINVFFRRSPRPSGDWPERRRRPPEILPPIPRKVVERGGRSAGPEDALVLRDYPTWRHNLSPAPHPSRTQKRRNARRKYWEPPRRPTEHRLAWPAPLVPSVGAQPRSHKQNSLARTPVNPNSPVPCTSNRIPSCVRAELPRFPKAQPKP